MQSRDSKIALRQTHKLMEAYNLQAGDILASMAGELTIEAGPDGTQPTWRIRLAQTCAQAPCDEPATM